MANRKTATQMLAEACGKPFDEVLEDSSRTFYMSPDEAVEYGLIDKVRVLCLFLLLLEGAGGVKVARRDMFWRYRVIYDAMFVNAAFALGCFFAVYRCIFNSKAVVYVRSTLYRMLF